MSISNLDFYYLDLSLSFFALVVGEGTVASQGLPFFTAARLANVCTDYPHVPTSAHLASPSRKDLRMYMEMWPDSSHAQETSCF